MGKTDIIDYLYNISVIFLSIIEIEQSIISVILLGRSIIAVSVSDIIGYIDSRFGTCDNIGIGIGYNRL